MRAFFWSIAAIGLGAVAGCSGGGTSPAPQPTPTLGGAGVAAIFNQKITFVIDVPSATSIAATSRTRRAKAATPVATTPYVSSGTGSIVLTLAEVNNSSTQQVPPTIPPINVPASCQNSASGCTLPVANVPAALGIDRYFVQTYSGANAAGSLVSSGFVDVTVPVSETAKPVIGGSAALSIGGFVANIVLSPSSLNFVTGTASDANVLVQALDATGATIVGAAQYATPITVSVLDTQNFTLNGSLSVAVNGPLTKPLVLHYGGGSSFGTDVTATSLDGRGASVSASPLPAYVLAPGSSPTPPTPVIIGGGAPTAAPTAAASGAPSVPPTTPPTAIPTALPTARPTAVPTATPKPTKAYSLYVADGQADTVSEYRIASQIESGSAPNPAATPSRVFRFDPTLETKAPVGGAGLSCQPPPGGSTGNGNDTAGVAVDPTKGTIFILPACTDGNNSFIFGYPAGAVGTPLATIEDPFAGGGFGPVDGLAIGAGSVYGGAFNSSEQLVSFPLTSNGQQAQTNIGSNCYTEFGTPSPGCFNVAALAGFGVDANGFAYLPALWADTATGDAAIFSTPAAVLAVRPFGTNATFTPYSAIAGLVSTVGGSGSPIATTVDGSILYVLTGQNTLNVATGPTTGTAYFPGLSACPPPSNPLINPVIPDPTNEVTQCADGQQHLYLAAYSLTGQLLGPTANGADIDLIPNFLIGGDTIGGFGCAQVPSGGGQFLAAQGGYVFVINQAPSCEGPNGSDPGAPVFAPEIDVYNTNGISGAHTNIRPVLRLALPSTSLPLAIAVGPSGTVTGGQALLRAPLSRPYRMNLYGHRRVLIDGRRRVRLAGHR